MELQHFSHNLPLILSDERIENEIDCDACDEPISGLTYTCTSCKFNLHKWCSELPRTLQHPQHPHPLSLSPQNFLTEFLCNFCHKGGFGFNFNCAKCHEFGLHVQCASLPSPDAFHFHGQDYRLVSKVSTNYDDVLYEIQSSDYKDYPSRVTDRHLEHLYRILPHRSKPFSDEDSPSCNICGEPCRGPTTLRSFNDEFFLHVRCALLPPTAKHPCHRHRFTLMPPPSVEANASSSEEFYCDICEQERNPKQWTYRCVECNLAGHTSCANYKGSLLVDLFSSNPLYVNVTTRIQEIRGEAIDIALSNVSKNLKEAIEFLKKKKQLHQRKDKRFVEREQEREQKDLSILKHPCHQHPLTLFKEEKNEAILCNGCHQPISGLTYICNRCKFYLHKSCAELPEQIRHTIHQDHPLFLTTREHKFRCMVCDFDCSGLSFECKSCAFEVELQCSTIHDEYKHQGHEHALSIIRYKPYENKVLKPSPNNVHGKPKVRSGSTLPCKACGDPCEGIALECFGCKFQLHVGCATAPPTTTLRCHRHALVLTYLSHEDPDDEYYCDACEEERKPNHWLYKCAVSKECRFVAEIGCWNLN